MNRYFLLFLPVMLIACGSEFEGSISANFTIPQALNGNVDLVELRVYSNKDSQNSQISCSTFMSTTNVDPDSKDYELLALRNQTYRFDQVNRWELTVPVGEQLILYVPVYEVLPNQYKVLVGKGCQDNLTIKENQNTTANIVLQDVTQ